MAPFPRLSKTLSGHIQNRPMNVTTKRIPRSSRDEIGGQNLMPATHQRDQPARAHCPLTNHNPQHRRSS